MGSYQKINTEMYFTLYRGDDFAFKGQVKDKDTGEAIDLTGWELKSTLKRSYMDDDTQANVKVSTGILDNHDALQGIFYLVYPQVQTENLTPGKYYFDVQREFEGTVITVIQGLVGVMADITTRTQSNPQGVQVALEDYTTLIGLSTQIEVIDSKVTDLQTAWDEYVVNNNTTVTQQDIDNAVAAIELLPGPVGPQGPTGAEGPAGDDGAQGIQGVAGNDGAQGLKGDTGDQGPAGTDGIIGVDGVQGIQGDAGPQGIQGIKGDTGDTGATGPQGVAGTNGIDGNDGAAGTGVTIVGSVANVSALNPAYAGATGDMYITANDGHGHVWNGATWNDVGQIQGPQGVKGDTGDQGVQGVQGPAGADGSNGLDGADGAQGIQGIQGATGADSTVAGPQGIAGTNGTDGESAYEVAVIDGFVGDETAWLASLVGATGAEGLDGTGGVKVDSIATLRTLDVSAIATEGLIELESYYSDWASTYPFEPVGGGTFRVSAATAIADNGGTHITLNDARQAIRLDARDIPIDNFGVRTSLDGVETYAVTNSAALEEAFKYAQQYDKALKDDGGRYYLKDAVQIYHGTVDGQSIVFRGAGKGRTIFKEASGETSVVGRYKNMFNCYVTEFNLQDLIFTGCTLDKNGDSNAAPASQYDWEQAHAFQLSYHASYVNTLIDYIEVTDVRGVDKVAGYFNMTSVTATNRVRKANFSDVHCDVATFNDTKFGQRGDLEITLTCDNINFTGIDAEYLQIEPTVASSASLTRASSIKDSVVSYVEFTDSGGYTTLALDNVTTTQSAIVRGVILQADRCTLRIDDRIAPYRGSTLKNSQVLIPWDSAGNTITPLYIGGGGVLLGADIHCKFDTVRFVIDDATAVNPAGYAIQSAAKISAYKTNAAQFVDCDFDARFEHICDSFANGGPWEFIRGELRCRGFGFQHGSYSSFVGSLRLIDVDTSQITGETIDLTDNGEHKLFIGNSESTAKPIDTKTTGAYTAVDADSLTYNRVDGSVTMHICGVDQVGKEFIFRNTAYANIALNAAAGVTFSGGSTIAQHEIIIAKCITSNGSTASHYELSGGTSA